MRLLFLTLCLFTFSYAQAATVYLTRHYEKTSEPKPGLTAQGQARAQALQAYFSDKPLARIYSTSYRRTLETATPVSRAKGLGITPYPGNDLAGLAAALRKLDQPVLVVGHSNTTPQLIALLGGPEFEIEENDYGTLYKLEINAEGTTMTQAVISQ